MPISSRSDHARVPRRAGGEACLLCGQPMPASFLELEHVPVNTTRLHSTAEGARNESRATIRLALCHGCGLIRNVDFDPTLVHYDERYENTLDFSPTFRTYQRDLARRLVSSYGLRGKDVIEVGPGSGEFLRVLCHEGGNRGVGFDPSLGDVRELGEGIRILPHAYDERYRGVPVDFICFRHVLEHVDDARRFLDGIRGAVGDRDHVVLYVEVPDAAYMLAGAGVWDVIYQHCSYFTSMSLQRVLEASGFTVRHVGTSFGRQYLFAETGVGARADILPIDVREHADMVSRCAGFAERCRGRIGLWDGRLRRLFDEGATAAMWGAGAKGVTFLNLVPAAERIPAVVDINPRKQGSFVAGTGQPIVPPERLLRVLPDTVLTTNALYRREIDTDLARMGLRPSIEVA